MQKVNKLQDYLLSKAQQAKLNVTLFLMNGFQLRGQVTGFDAFTVILMSEGKQQMIYKHAISTIVPEKPVSMDEVSLI